MQILSLSTIYVLDFGHLPLAGLLWMGSLLVRIGGLVANSDVLDELFGRLLEGFSPGRRRAVRKLLRDVVRDQALMLQLTPKAMEVFNASILPRPGLRYGAVVAQATHARYRVLHGLLAFAPGRVPRRLAAAQARALQRGHGAVPSPDANDGIVPKPLPGVGAPRPCHTVADHLDVPGHFQDAQRRPPHVDWLVTGSHFDRPRFEALWEDVTQFLLGDAPSRPKGRRATARGRTARAASAAKKGQRSRAAVTKR